MRSGSSLTDSVCRDATSPDPEGIWKNAQKSKIPQIQPRILISDTVYSLNPNGVHLHGVADGLRTRSEGSHHELTAFQNMDSATRPNRASMLAAEINESVRFQRFVSAA